MTQHQLKIGYEEADLQLDFDEQANVALRINGLIRDRYEAVIGANLPETITIKLRSPVQTAYEWHEIVEATVSYSTSQIVASIEASKQLICSKTISRDIDTTG